MSAARWRGARRRLTVATAVEGITVRGSPVTISLTSSEASAQLRS